MEWKCCHSIATPVEIFPGLLLSSWCHAHMLPTFTCWHSPASHKWHFVWLRKPNPYHHLLFAASAPGQDSIKTSLREPHHDNKKERRIPARELDKKAKCRRIEYSFRDSIRVYPSTLYWNGISMPKSYVLLTLSRSRSRGDLEDQLHGLNN